MIAPDFAPDQRAELALLALSLQTSTQTLDDLEAAEMVGCGNASTHFKLTEAIRNLADIANRITDIGNGIGGVS